jgi:parallel beta-helix repeat protein
MKKAVSTIIIALLLTSVLLFSSSIRPVRASATIIVPDDYATIQAAINAANYGDTVLVRNGIYYENVIANKTISLTGEDPYLTIINGSLGNVIVVTADDVQISSLHITFGARGVYIDDAIGTIVANNVIDYNGGGIEIDLANQTTVANNLLDHNGGAGIYLYYSFNNTIIGNTISNTRGSRSAAPFSAQYSNGSLIYHNTFINNIWAPGRTIQSFNKWDDGYPTGGNYWGPWMYPSDIFKGPYQNETGSDGIIDGGYTNIYDANIHDNYPLAKPWPWGPHDVGVTYIGEIKYSNVVVCRTFIWAGSTLRFDTFIMNYGDFLENVTVTAYANGTIIDQEYDVGLAEHNSTILTLQWNSTGFPLGIYNITVYASPVPGETDITDNALSSWMSVYVFGDVNGDGKVDIRDIALLARAFGQTVPPANPDLDVNQDWKIDIRDIAVVAKHFGGGIS